MDTIIGEFILQGSTYTDLKKYRVLSYHFADAQFKGRKLVVHLDGCFGWNIEFIEQTFGRLAREFGASAVLKTLKLECSRDESIIETITTIIEFWGTPKIQKIDTINECADTPTDVTKDNKSFNVEEKIQEQLQLFLDSDRHTSQDKVNLLLKAYAVLYSTP